MGRERAFWISFWGAVGLIVAGSAIVVAEHGLPWRSRETLDVPDAAVAPPPRAPREAAVDAADEVDDSDHYRTESADAATMSPACWDRLMATRDALDRLRASVDGCAPKWPSDPPDLGCVTAGAETWTTEVADASVVADCALDLVLRVAHLTDAGTSLGDTFPATEAWNGRNIVALQALGDYDHDGVSEVLFTYTNDYKEGARTSTSTVLTVRGGAVVPYAPAASFAPSDARDLDGDGRLDLVGRGPFGVVTVLTTINEIDVAPEIFAAHALPDGTFSTTDAVARGFTTSKCAGAPRSLQGTVDSIDADALAIVCARVAGVARATIDGWITRACPADAGPYDCRPWTTKMAAIKTQ